MIQEMKPFSLKLIFALSLLLSPFFASAGNTQNVGGYAWSPNIGWISFNCVNTATCGTVDYGVHKNATGYLTGNEADSTPGYAWSASVGWIQFGGLTGFPIGPYSQNAQIDGSGNLRGWARALSYGGGWDGWISLSGTSPVYGVTFSSNLFYGYAWGSDVVGWVSFDAGGPDGVKILNPVDPAAFSLGGSEDIRVQVLPVGTADSEQKNVYVIPNTAFSTAGHTVRITITSSPASASGNTYQYSFNGGISYGTAGAATLDLSKGSNNYGTGFGFKVRVIRTSGASALSEQTITLQGVDITNSATVTKTFTLKPVSFDPKFKEI